MTRTALHADSLRKRLNDVTTERIPAESSARQRPEFDRSGSAPMSATGMQGSRRPLERSQTYNHSQSPRRREVAILAPGDSGSTTPTGLDNSMAPSTPTDIQRMQYKYGLYRDAVKRLKKDLDSALGDASQLRTKLARTQDDLRTATDQSLMVQPLRAELKRISSELHNQTAAKEQFAEQLNTMQHRMDQLQQQLSASEGQHRIREQDLHTLLNTRDDLADRLRVQSDATTEQLASLQQRQVELESSLEQNAQALKNCVAERDQMAERIQQMSSHQCSPSPKMVEPRETEQTLAENHPNVQPPSPTLGPTLGLPEPQAIPLPPTRGATPAPERLDQERDEHERMMRQTVTERDDLATQVAALKEELASQSHSEQSPSRPTGMVTSEAFEACQEERNDLRNQLSDIRHVHEDLQADLAHARATILQLRKRSSPNLSPSNLGTSSAGNISNPFDVSPPGLKGQPSMSTPTNGDNTRIPSPSRETSREMSMEVQQLRFSLTQARHQIRDFQMHMSEQQSTSQRTLVALQAEVAEAQNRVMRAESHASQIKSNYSGKETQLRFEVEQSEHRLGDMRRQLERAKADLAFQAMQTNGESAIP